MQMCIESLVTDWIGQQVLEHPPRGQFRLSPSNRFEDPHMEIQVVSTALCRCDLGAPLQQEVPKGFHNGLEHGTARRFRDFIVKGDLRSHIFLDSTKPSLHLSEALLHPNQLLLCGAS